MASQNDREEKKQEDIRPSDIRCKRKASGAHKFMNFNCVFESLKLCELFVLTCGTTQDRGRVRWQGW